MAEKDTIARGLEVLYNRWLEQHGDPRRVRVYDVVWNETGHSDPAEKMAPAK